jgi:hypothetical protein
MGMGLGPHCSGLVCQTFRMFHSADVPFANNVSTPRDDFAKGGCAPREASPFYSSASVYHGSAYKIAGASA